MYWYIYNHHGNIRTFQCDTERALDEEIKKFLNNTKDNYFISPYGKFEGTEEELLFYIKQMY